MPRAIFVSPHLDDVAFSCAGTAIRLAQDGWHVTVVTVFTQSVRNPTGFALECQLDKGLAPEVDYMALRRAEDDEFCRRASLAPPVHLNLPEAPHRGYYSASALFGDILPDDRLTIPEFTADLLFGPQALGNHIDHQHVVNALPPLSVRYQDAPYAIRLGVRSPVVVDTYSVLERKLWAIEAYATQIPFQFGSVRQMRDVLSAWDEQFTVGDEALLQRWPGFHASSPVNSGAAIRESACESSLRSLPRAKRRR